MTRLLHVRRVVDSLRIIRLVQQKSTFQGEVDIPLACSRLPCKLQQHLSDQTQNLVQTP